MATSPKKTLKIAAIGDLHVHEHSQGTYSELFSRISQEAGIALLCGDLTNFGLPQEAENLAADLAACRVPILAILGNHDYHSGHQQEVKQILSKAGVHFLEDETFEVEGVGFAGVKGFGGGFDNHILTAFGEPAIKNFVDAAVQEALSLENSLRELDQKKIVVVLHYSPIAATVVGEPKEIFPFLGSSRLEETVDRFNVAAVLHGHAHHGTLKGATKKGTAVYNCALTVLKQHSQAKPFLLLEI